jgi:hypothetical protein
MNADRRDIGRPDWAWLDPHLLPEALAEVAEQVHRTATPSLVEENRRLHPLRVELAWSG